MRLCAGRFSHCCGPRHVEQSPYVRVSFASASHAELRQGMERLGATLRAAQGRAGPAGSHAPAEAAASDLTAGLPASAAGAAAQSASDSIPSSGQGASLPANEQNGHADSAAQKPSGRLHHKVTENGRTAGVTNGQSTGSASKAAVEYLPGLRVNEDAGKDTQHVDPIPDGAAKTLASGSLGITADALAPRFAKTLDPRDSAWKC